MKRLTILHLACALAIGSGAASASTMTPAAWRTLGVQAMDTGRNTEAVRDFARAARAGDPDAQYWYGVAYWQGIAVHQSLFRARYWFQKAAAKGNIDAIHYLSIVLPRNSTEARRIAASTGPC